MADNSDRHDSTDDESGFDLSRRTIVKGLAATGLFGGTLGGAGTASAVPDDAIVDVGAGSFTTQVPEGYDYATPMTSGDVFTTANEEPPLPSNDWWSGIHLGYNVYDDYTYPHANGATVAQPYYGYPTERGLQLQIPSQFHAEYTDQEISDSKLVRMDTEEIPRLTVGHTANTSFADVRLDDYGDWHVRSRWGDGTANQIDVTMVRGCPFTFYEYQGGGAEITIWERFDPNADDTLLADSNVSVFADLGNVVGITVEPNLADQSTQHFGLFAPEGATWDGLGTSTVTSNLADAGYLTVAVLPDGTQSTLEEFEQYAYNFVRDTQVDWNYVESDANGDPVSEVQTTYSFDLESMSESAATGTLAGLFPHQWKHSDAPLTDYTYWSPRGDMHIFAGTSFQTSLKYPGILPFTPDIGTHDSTQLATYVDNLRDDYDPYVAQGVPNEAYWAGKDLMRNTGVIPIAEQLGKTDAKQYFVDAVQNRLENFFDVRTNSWSVDGVNYSTEDGQEVTYYHEDLGLLQTYPGGEFGAVEAINDHHLQFGYFIYDAAEIARQDPQWADDYGDIIELMIRDYANWEHPDKSNPQDPVSNPGDSFPFLRNFEPYMGHSYAGGIQGNDWGNNQESASEAVGAYAAMIRWGEITGNDALRDAGIWMYTHEINAMWEYWFDHEDDSHTEEEWGATIDPPGYRCSAHGEKWEYSPMTWDVGYWRHVYWNMGDPIEMYGINWIPMGGHSFFLGRDQNYAQTNWDYLIQSRQHFDIADTEAGWPDGWQQAAWGYAAMFDPSYAVDLMEAELPIAPEGSSTPYIYKFVHFLNEVGTPDTSVVADTPFYRVFDDGTERTYVAYNAENTATTVTFSDGTTLDVPANSIATSADTGGGGDTTAPSAPTNLSETGTTDTSISFDWGAASDSGGSGLAHYNVYVDGEVDHTVAAGTTSTTVGSLSAETTYDVHVTAVDGAGNESTDSNTVTATTEAPPDGDGDVVFAVNAGGDAYTAADGTQFQADTSVSGGATASVSDAIANTDDDALYQSERWGDFTYDISVANGTYDVVFHLAEIYFESADSRVFGVSVEGTEEISSLDIYSQVGHDAAMVQTVSGVDVSDGSLTITGSASVDNAKVSAIEVLDASGDGSISLPTTVDAVNYDASQGDFQTESNGEGGESIGWTDAGDWWEYQSVADGSGTADIAVNASSPYDGTTFHVEVDGTDVSGTVTVPNTGGWQEWTEITAATGVDLAPDSTVRVVAETGSWNFDALTLK